MPPILPLVGQGTTAETRSDRANQRSSATDPDQTSRILSVSSARNAVPTETGMFGSVRVDLDAMRRFIHDAQRLYECPRARRREAAPLEILQHRADAGWTVARSRWRQRSLEARVASMRSLTTDIKGNSRPSSSIVGCSVGVATGARARPCIGRRPSVWRCRGVNIRPQPHCGLCRG